jgi:hypothetical protein
MDFNPSLGSAHIVGMDFNPFLGSAHIVGLDFNPACRFGMF